MEKRNGEREGGFSDTVREFINSSALYGMQADAGEKTADEEPRDRREEQDRVRLMTLHASKGLEFDTVFLIGVNRGCSRLQCRSIEQEEEERRLFFVGITRAKNSLELSWYTNPGEPGVLGEPGRYLRMIPEQVLERCDGRAREREGVICSAWDAGEGADPKKEGTCTGSPAGQAQKVWRGRSCR